MNPIEKGAKWILRYLDAASGVAALNTTTANVVNAVTFTVDNAVDTVGTTTTPVIATLSQDPVTKDVTTTTGNVVDTVTTTTKQLVDDIAYTTTPAITSVSSTGAVASSVAKYYDEVNDLWTAVYLDATQYPFESNAAAKARELALVGKPVEVVRIYPIAP